MRAVGLAAVLGLAAAACGEAGKSESACRAEAQELQALLRAADTGPSVLYVDRDIRLVPRPDLAAGARNLPRGLTATINRDGRLRFQGITDYNAGDLIPPLREALREAPAAPNGESPVVYLVIDAEAPWSDVRRVVTDIMFAELDVRIGFVFGVATPREPPPRSWMDDKLDDILTAAAPGDRAVELATAVEKVVKPCPALARAFGRVGGVEPEDKATSLIDALGPALVECRCDLDVPALRSAMYRVLHDDLAAGAQLVTVELDAKTKVSAPFQAPWRDVAGKLRDVESPVYFTTDM